MLQYRTSLPHYYSLFVAPLSPGIPVDIATSVDDLFWLPAVAAENKNTARMIPQTTCIELAISHRDILRLYASSSSTASAPCDKVHEPRLAKNDTTLMIIHLMFFPEKNVPSFRITMEETLNTVAQIRNLLSKVRTANHNNPRATDLRPAFHPGGVVVADVDDV